MNRRVQLALLTVLLLMALIGMALGAAAEDGPGTAAATPMSPPPIVCCEVPESRPAYATGYPYPYPYPPPTDGRAWMPSIFNSYPYPQPEVKR